LTGLVVGGDAPSGPGAASLRRKAISGTVIGSKTSESTIIGSKTFSDSVVCSIDGATFDFILVPPLSLELPALAIFAQDAILALMIEATDL
jgi:hypothetical protein